MNVLIISKSDWANVGYSLECALKSVGVDAISIKHTRHNYAYPKQSIICRNKTQLKKYARNADILQFMHSVNTNLNIGNQFDGRKGVAVFHGGSAYRNGASRYNRFWNERAQLTLIQTGDLLDIGEPKAKNQVWFLPPINTEELKPVYKQKSEKRIIMHCPSSPNKKGTKQFNKLMDKLERDPQIKDKFIYEYGHNIGWQKNIERKKRCDIYFDACCPTIGKNKYGEWGISALESCCLGKVVVSHFLSADRYRKEYGKECLIQHANNMKEVERQIRRLILMPFEEFDQLRRNTRKWVEENHSYKKIGQRLVDLYNQHLTWEGK